MRKYVHANDPKAALDEAQKLVERRELGCLTCGLALTELPEFPVLMSSPGEDSQEGEPYALAFGLCRSCERLSDLARARARKAS